VLLDHASRDPALVGDQREQQMLCPDVVVTVLLRLLAGALEHPANAWRRLTHESLPIALGASTRRRTEPMVIDAPVGLQAERTPSAITSRYRADREAYSDCARSPGC
jgi:hypothetical protein